MLDCSHHTHGWAIDEQFNFPINHILKVMITKIVQEEGVEIKIDSKLKVINIYYLDRSFLSKIFDTLELIAKKIDADYLKEKDYKLYIEQKTELK